MKKDIFLPHAICDDTAPTLLNCGCIIGNSERESVNRTQGRLDFQLIYFYRGGGTFMIDEKEQAVGAGEMVLYSPAQKQEYVLQASSIMEVYWIYFYNDCAVSLMKKLSFHSSTVFRVGISDKIREYFLNILYEVEHPNQESKWMSGIYIQELMIALSRKVQGKENKLQPYTENTALSKIKNVAQIIESEYQYDIQMDNYAKLCGFSTCYFVSVFKEIMGISPAAYRIRLRIQKAQSMLRLKQEKIALIANTVGYADPLYFSRVFKKRVGCSPEEYRKQQFYS